MDSRSVFNLYLKTRSSFLRDIIVDHLIKYVSLIEYEKYKKKYSNIKHKALMLKRKYILDQEFDIKLIEILNELLNLNLEI